MFREREHVGHLVSAVTHCKEREGVNLAGGQASDCFRCASLFEFQSLEIEVMRNQDQLSLMGGGKGDPFGITAIVLNCEKGELSAWSVDRDGKALVADTMCNCIAPKLSCRAGRPVKPFPIDGVIALKTSDDDRVYPQVVLLNIPGCPAWVVSSIAILFAVC